MSVYYSNEIDVYLKGNSASAVMHWFDDDETYPYDEWGEEVILHDVSMMSETAIKEMIIEKFKGIIEREFNADKLFFNWKVK